MVFEQRTEERLSNLENKTGTNSKRLEVQKKKDEEKSSIIQSILSRLTNAEETKEDKTTF